MNIKLAYGKKTIDFFLKDKNIKSILQTPKTNIVTSSQDIVKTALDNPISCEKLSIIAKRKKPEKVVIVVNDITRPTPYQTILPPLLSELKLAGVESDKITFIVATGIHRPHSEEENISIFGQEICEKYIIKNHDCDSNLKFIKKLSNGMELIINKDVAEADLLITTGLVGLHYFAGYSGGRKSILPGVASRSLIEANHKMMSDKRACLGNYTDNPVNEIMLEAAQAVGVDFIVNVVSEAKNTIAYCAAGDLHFAWLEAVIYCEKMNVIKIKEKADIVIASCGGYPKDINMYQAQKALDAASLAVKDNGSIILIAECSEGLGEETFEKWIKEANSVNDIMNRFAENFELGGHKAYAICRILQNTEIILISGMNENLVKSLFLTPVNSMDTALEYVFEKHGDNAQIFIMPEAPKLAVKLENT